GGGGAGAGGGGGCGGVGTRGGLQIGFGTTLAVVALIAFFPRLASLRILPWLLVPIAAGWLYWGWRLARAEWFARDIRKGLRVLNRDPSALRWNCSGSSRRNSEASPCPRRPAWAPRSDTSSSASYTGS